MSYRLNMAAVFQPAIFMIVVSGTGG